MALAGPLPTLMSWDTVWKKQSIFSAEPGMRFRPYIVHEKHNGSWRERDIWRQPPFADIASEAVIAVPCEELSNGHQACCFHDCFSPRRTCPKPACAVQTHPGLTRGMENFSSAFVYLMHPLTECGSFWSLRGAENNLRNLTF